VTRWLTLFLVSAILAGTLAMSGIVKGAWDGIWIGLFFLIVLFGFSRIWRLRNDPSQQR